MPTVSVITPVYNRFSFLPRAIDSVLNQSFQDFEIIVVDDGSKTDITPIISEFPSVKLVRQKNRGTAIARNTGVLHSTSEYVAFLDSDDLWKKDKLQKQFQLMQHDADLGACYTRFDIINGNDEFLGFTKPVVGHESYFDLLKDFTMTISTTMVRRSVFQSLGGFDPLQKFASDMDFLLKIALFSKIRFIDESLACCRSHDNNVHSNALHILPITLNIFEKHIAYGKLVGDKEVVRTAILGRKAVLMLAGQKLVGIARDFVFRGDICKAIWYLWLAAKTARSFRPHVERFLLIVENLMPSSDPPDLRVLGLKSEARRF